MNIVVCIKQVPDTTEVKINPKTGTLIRDGVKSIINPDDKSGLETALRIKEEVGANITVISMGPKQAELALREAIAMGADRAILLSDKKFAGADTLATSSTLAGAIKKLDYDIIITGRQAIDGDTAQVGVQIAEHLDIPSVSYVEDLNISDDSLILKRMFEDRYYKVKVKAPCLITTLKEINEPRYMRIKRIYQVFDDSKLEMWTLDDIDVDENSIGLSGSPTKVKKSFTKGTKATGVKYEATPKEAASIILDKLKEKYII